MRKLILAALITCGFASAAQAQNVHIGPPAAPIAMAVTVPAGSDMIYVSGITPSPVPGGAAGAPPVYGDTKTQVASILAKIKDILAAQGYGFGDVVMMRVCLVGDPALGGKMDFPGRMAAYTQEFGTAAQPNKPARITTQVAALAGPGLLAEIEVQAAKAHK